MMYQKIQPGSIIKCTKGNRAFKPGDILTIDRQVLQDERYFKRQDTGVYSLVK